MIRPAPRLAPVFALGTALGLLSGCKAVPQLAGAVAGILTGTATVNPAIAFAVAVSVRAGTDELQRWYGRSMSHAEQQAIANAAAPLAEGQTADWHIHHFIPFNDERGHLAVTRVFATALTTCKDIVFSVEDGKDALHDLYTTTLCVEPQGWMWAKAEPAVPRWGYLQ